MRPLEPSRIRGAIILWEMQAWGPWLPLTWEQAMPYFPYNYNPGPPGPIDWTGVVIFVLLLVIICAVTGVGIWISHRHEDQHRTSHQH
jgi:hypothetical protein